MASVGIELNERINMIDFTKVLSDQDGKPLQDIVEMQAKDSKEIIPLTLGKASSHALMVQDQNDANLSGDEKFHRGALSAKIRDNSSCDIKSEDISLIKNQLAKLYSPLVIYAAYPLLDESYVNKS